MAKPNSDVIATVVAGNSNVPTAPTAAAQPAGLMSILSSALTKLTGGASENAAAVQPVPAQPSAFTFTANTSSSPVDSAESSPRAGDNKQNKKVTEDTPSPSAVASAAGAAGAAAAAGQSTNSSTPSSFEHVTHSQTHSPETGALHEASPIILSANSSPFGTAVPNASNPKAVSPPSLLKLKAEVNSAPNSGSTTPDLTASPNLDAIPAAAAFNTDHDSKTKTEQQQIKSLEEMQTLRLQLVRLKQEHEKTIHENKNTQLLIARLTKEVEDIKLENQKLREKNIAGVKTMPQDLEKIDHKALQEQHMALHQAFKLLEDRENNLRGHLERISKEHAQLQIDLKDAREVIRIQNVNEAQNPIYLNGLNAGRAQAAYQASEAARAAQQRHAAQQVQTAAAAAAAAHAERDRRQKSMQGL